MIYSKNKENNIYITLSEASKISGISRDYLNVLIHREKLRAVKIGKNWLTTKAWISECKMPNHILQNQGSEYLSLFNAAKIANVSSGYLNVAVRRGKLRAVKLGRNWFTTSEWLSDYQKSVGRGISAIAELRSPTSGNLEVGLQTQLAKAEKDELRNLKSSLILEREKVLETNSLFPEIKISSRELKVEEKENILDSARLEFIEKIKNQFRKNDVSNFEKVSRKYGISKALKSWSHFKFAAVSGLAVIVLTVSLGLTSGLIKFPEVRLPEILKSDLTASIFSDVIRNFPNDLPIFSKWLADSVNKPLTLLKSKPPSELVIESLKYGKSKIITPEEILTPINTFADAEALDLQTSLASETSPTPPYQGGESGEVLIGGGNFTLLENRLSSVEARLNEQLALTNSELSLQKKTILGTLETLIGISKLVPSYPISTFVVQGQPATLTTYSVSPSVHTGFDRLAASYLSLSHNAEINGSLTVKSGGIFNTVSVSGNTTLTGDATIGGTLGVTGDTTLGNLTITGVVSAANSSFSLNNASTTNLTVSGNAWLNKLAVTGTATTTFNNPITSFSGNFIIAADSANNILLNPYGGNIGIGTTTPSNLLSISGATTPSIGLNVNSSTGNWVLGIDTADSNKFKIASSTAVGTNARLTIDGNGNVGIASTSPSAVLSVNVSNATGVANALNITSATSSLLYVRSDGFVGIGTTSPGSLFSVNSTGNVYLGGDLTVSGTVNFQSSTSFSSGFTLSGILTQTASSTSSIISSVASSTATHYSFDARGAGPIFNILKNNSSKFYIDNLGNVGVATTTFPISPFSYGVNLATSTFVYGNQFISGGLGVGVATTTSGAIQTSGDVFVGRNLFVSGNSTTLGASSADTLTINSSIKSNLIPDLNAARDLGSSSFYWDDAFIDTLTVNNISAASTTIAGTQSETFTLNSDNNSQDSQNAEIIFYRGTVVPNALFTWNSATSSKRFEMNQVLYINNGSASTTNPSLTVKGVANQTADILKLTDSGSNNLFTVSPYGAVNIATSTYPSNIGLNIATSTNIFGKLTVGTGTLDILSGNIISNSGSFNIVNTANSNLTFYTNNLERMRIDNSGNVGIGTTSPGFALSVAGQCVTGDTRLRRRRRRKRGAWSLELGAWKEPNPSSANQVPSSSTIAYDDEYIYDEPAIVDINPGDEIASLNEKTGQIVWSKVNALMDMGVKPIYKLTTISGKTIRTTGNHPYLVKTSSGKTIFKNLWKTICDIFDVINQKTSQSGAFGILDMILPGLTPAFIIANQKNLSSISVDNVINQLGVGPAGNRTPENLVLIQSPYHTEPNALKLYQENSAATISQGLWTKVADLKEGMEIAVMNTDGKIAVWDRIKKIEKLPSERVYDIEVENTHNFVAGHYIDRRTSQALSQEHEELYAAIKSLELRAWNLENKYDTIQNNEQRNSKLREIRDLAGRYGINKENLFVDQGFSEGRTIWNNVSDTQSGSFSSSQYSGRAREKHKGGFSQISSDSDGFAQRNDDYSESLQRYEIDHSSTIPGVTSNRDYTDEENSIVTTQVISILKNVVQTLSSKLQVPTKNIVFGGIIAHNTYISATTTLSNDLVVDTNTLFVDSVNNRVGIGTTGPGELLHLKTDQNADTVSVIENASAGTGAFASLEIRNGTDVNNALRLGALGTEYTTTGGFIQDAGLISAETNLSGGLSLITRAAAPIRFYTSGHTNERMRIESTGNVGIGTTTPGQLLSVNGNGYFAGNLNVASSTTLLNASTTNLTVSASTFLANATTTGLSVNGGTLLNSLAFGAATGTSLTVTGGSSFAGSSFSGNVGIGTTAPNGKLNIISPVNTYPTSAVPSLSLRQAANNTYGWDWIQDDQITGNLYLHRVENSVSTNLMSFMRTSGNLGIGTTTPNNLLSLSSATTPALGFTTATGFGWTVGMDTADSNKFKIASSTAVGTNARLTIDGNGNVGIGTAAPGAILEIAGGSSNTRPRVTAGSASYASVLDFYQGTTLEGYVGITTGPSEMNVWSNGNLNLYGGSVIRAYIAGTTGNVGIASTSPSAVLSVNVSNATGVANALNITSATSSLLYVRSDGNVGIGTTTPITTFAVNGSGYFGSALGVGILNTTANTFRVGQCVTGDTRLRRRRRRKSRNLELGTWNLDSDDQAPSSKLQALADRDYIYDEVAIVDIKPGDEVLSLNEKSGQLEWQPVLALYDMGEKPVYKMQTASGKTIRTTSNHPYLTRYGWIPVGDLREGNEIACPVESERLLTNTNNADYLSYDKFGSFFRQSSDVFSHKPFINGNNLANFYYRWIDKSRELLICFVQNIGIFFVGTRIFRKIGCYGYNNNIVMGTIEIGGRNYSRRPIFYGSEVGEGKRDKNNLSGFIENCRHRRKDYSKSQMMAPIVSKMTNLRERCEEFSATESKVAFVLPALPSEFPFQFFLMKVLSSLNSIVAILKKLSNRADEILWDRIISIDYCGVERVWDISVKNTHNFIAGHYIDTRTKQALTEEQEEIVALRRNLELGTWSLEDSKRLALLAAKNGINQKTAQSAAFGDSTKQGNPGIDVRSNSIANPQNLSSAYVDNLRTLDLEGVEPSESGRQLQTSLPSRPRVKSAYQIIEKISNRNILQALSSKLQVPELNFIVFGGIIAHNTAFIVDGSGNVGVGTTTPVSQLSVASSASSKTPLSVYGYGPTGQTADLFQASASATATAAFVITSAGRVGIGTAAPGAKLNVIGETSLGSVVSNQAVFGETASLLNIGSISSGYSKIILIGPTTLQGGIAGWSGQSTAADKRTAEISFERDGSTAASGKITFHTSGGDAQSILERMTILSTGNVGIASTSPSAVLSVNVSNATGVANALNITSATSSLLYVRSDGFVGIGISATTSKGFLTINTAPRTSVATSTANTGDPYAFNVVNATSSYFYIGADGRIGIGTTSPSNNLLAVQSGNVYFGGGLQVSGNSLFGNATTTGLSVNGGTLLNSLSFGAATGTSLTVTGGSSFAGSSFSGNVGIGTAAPARPLHVNGGNTDTYPRVSSTATNKDAAWESFDGSNAVYSGLLGGGANCGAGNWAVYTSGCRMAITSAGNVGIGTTSPGQLLSVAGNAHINSNFSVAGGSMLSNATTTGLSVNGGTLLNSLSFGAATGTSLTVTGGSSFAGASFSGNVGIGTAAPNRALTIGNTSTSDVRVNVVTGTAGIGYLTFSDTVDIRGSVSYNHSSNSLFLGVPSNSQVVSVVEPGNVGIGTTTPNNLLTISSATTPAVGFTTATGFGWTVGMDTADSNKFKIASSTAVGTNARLTIDGNGNVGINTTSPTSTLQVVGTMNVIPTAGGNSGLYVNSSGNVGIGTASPGGILDVRGMYSLFGTAQGYTYIKDNQFNFMYGTNDDTPGYINWSGYLGGATQFRDLVIANGKNVAIATFDGSTGNLGVGETSPGSRLAVSGGATIGASYDTTAAPSNGLLVEGNVGIASTSPSAVLSVNVSNATGVANAFNITSATSSLLYVRSDGFVGIGISSTSSKGFLTINTATRTSVATSTANTGDPYAFNVVNATSSLFFIGADGRIGIGTTSPSNNRLAVQSGNVYLGDGLQVSGNSLFSNATTTGLSVNGGTLLNSLSFGAATGTSLTVTGGSSFAGASFSGNVGIGTTTPSVLLELSSSAPRIKITQTAGTGTASDIWFTNTARTWQIGQNTNLSNDSFEIYDRTAAADRLVIDSSGLVGIGTTTPNNLLTIAGNTTPSLNFKTNNTNSGWAVGVDTADSNKFKIASSTAVGTNARLTIDGNGNVGIASTSPSAVLSVNVSNATGVANAFNITSATSSLLYVRSDGNVGIGTAGPGKKLEVNEVNANTDILRISRSGVGSYDFRMTAAMGGSATDLVIDPAQVSSGFLFRSQNAAGSLLNALGIDRNGNVGIASTSPSAVLSVNVSGATGDTAAFNVTNATGSLLFVRSDGSVGVGTTTPGLGVNKFKFVVQGNASFAGCVGFNAASNSGTCVDVAESYPTSEPVEAGDIVQIGELGTSNLELGANNQAPSSKFGVQKATSTSKNIIGIISTNPAILINGYDTIFGGISKSSDSSTAPVALAGRVPVKVSLENGPINIGDRITISSISGVGMRATATTTAATVGIALENYQSPNQNTEGKILVFVNLGQPKLASEASLGSLASLASLTSDINADGHSLLNVKSISGLNNLWKIDENGNIIAQSVETQRLTVGGGAASGVTIYDRQTTAPKCIYIEGGVVKTSDGACGTTVNTGAPAEIVPVSDPIIPVTAPAATTTPMVEPLATSTEPILTATTTPEIITTSIETATSTIQ